ncbi:hypothetical protein G7Y89_g3424 [Cudoniella acicularis]|uniref:Uncharacterized protein n=1 Tax=Cudoniella acicularis TaxID=354080 RepID=A0A8H4RSP7_9HELO|nr:hypothetical protein G7Y89_g3424 [Cudoniella acicularis]
MSTRDSRPGFLCLLIRQRRPRQGKRIVCDFYVIKQVTIYTASTPRDRARSREAREATEQLEEYDNLSDSPRIRLKFSDRAKTKYGVVIG